MNLVMASVLLLAMLAFQPTLIYGTKNLASSARTNNHGDGNSNPVNTARKIKSSKYGKRHSSEASHPLYSPALSASSKLVLSLESGDVLVRAARGAAVDKQNPTPVVASNGGKRTKSGNNKKQNKIPSTRENGSSSAAAAGLGAAAGATSTTSANGGRKHLEKKFSATSGLSTAQQSSSGSSNGKGKQRQMLKSQNHQGKRSGNGNGSNKAIRDDGEMLPGESEKTSACRYAKSVWSECDAKTNTRSRTLSLKKGDASCQQTRTMEKKCKKSCRYEKGAWSECINGQMTREDKLKATGGGSESSSCEPMRSINKKCNPNNGGGAAGKQAGGGSKKERKNKDKGSRRNQTQQQQQQQQHQQP